MSYGLVGLARIHDVESIEWENEQVSLGIVEATPLSHCGLLQDVAIPEGFWTSEVFRRGDGIVPSSKFHTTFFGPLGSLGQLPPVWRNLFAFLAVFPPPTTNGGGLSPRKYATKPATCKSKSAYIAISFCDRKQR